MQLEYASAPQRSGQTQASPDAERPRPDRRPLAIATAALLLLTACHQPGNVEAVSLLGKRLSRPEFDAGSRAKLEDNLAEAQARYDAGPADEDAIIWLGRRLAYLGRYNDAIDVYTRGLDLHPDSARLLRHRGHRYITLRRFDRAIADLARAAELSAGQPDEIEPDGAPNRLDIPLSTTQGNIYYHLGLAHYLNGDLEPALRAYNQRLALDRNDDNHAATAYWRYLILRRLDRPADAIVAVRDVTPGMRIIENEAYHQLVLLYKGEASLDELFGAELDSGPLGADVQNPTLLYGVSMYHLFDGDRARARDLWREIIDDEDASWAAFGYIAAEAELARTRRGD